MPELRHLNVLDFVVVAVYLLMMAGTGAYVARYNRKTSDYFKGGGQIPWLLSSLSLFVSGFSAFIFVGAAGFTYRNGAVALLLFTSAAWGYLIGYLLYGPLWRRTRIDTPMEFLGRRYSQSTTYFYSVLSVVPNVLILGIAIYTLCIFISTALGLNQQTFDLGVATVTGFQLILLVIGLVMIFYTVLGGLWAVVVTDALQFVILLIVTLLVLPLAYIKLGDGSIVGGVRQLFAESPDGYFGLAMQDQPTTFFAAYLINTVLGYNVNWHIAQRYYSVPDERDTRKMALLCVGLSLLLPLMWILPVMTTRVLYPGLEQMWPTLSAPSEAAFVTLALDVLPHGMLGIMVAAMIAATMSSVDTTFNWLAAVITKDVFVPISRSLRDGRELGERTQLAIGKLSVLGLGAFAIVVAFGVGQYGGAFDVYLKVHSLYNAPMFIPVLLGLVFTRTPWWSGMAAFSAGVLAILAVDVLINQTAGIAAEGLGIFISDIRVEVLGVALGRYEVNTLVGTAAATACFFSTALASRRSGTFADRIARFEKDLRTPAHAPAGFRLDLSALGAYRVAGVLALIVAGLLIVLSLFTARTGGALLNLAGGMLAAVAGTSVLWWTTHYQKRLSSHPPA